MSDRRLTEIEERLARIEKVLDRLLQILETDQSVPTPWRWNLFRKNYHNPNWDYTSLDSTKNDEEL